MTTRGYAHRRNSKLANDSAIAADIIAERRDLVARDLAFQAELAAAIHRGDENLKSVVGKFKVPGRPAYTTPAPITVEWMRSLRQGLETLYPPPPTPPSLSAMLDRLRRLEHDKP